MYLSNLKIWNFRKVGTGDGELNVKPDNPGIDISLDPKLNVLIGENDSGKTSIVDAIRFVLGTRTYEHHRLTQEDFFVNEDSERADELKVECLFSGFNNHEAGQFLEWIHINDDNEYELNVWLSAVRRDNKIKINIRAGLDDEGSFIEGNARDLLRTTYLKPLRDAETEMSPGYRSRLAQILLNHPVFAENKDEEGHHELEEYIADVNSNIKEFFEQELTKSGNKGGKEIKDSIGAHTKEFLYKKDDRSPDFQVSPPFLPRILRQLGLELEESKSGLGSLNKLFMAAELLQLEIEEGLKLALIEELEAHLHPQAQLRVINALRDNQEETAPQFILTTHSTTLASNIRLENLILCYDKASTDKGNPSGCEVFSMKPDETGLYKDDYEFLFRFLDATKANLFFAKGVILVEGDAENILLPTIAELLGRELHKYGVSIVNVGSKALLRYAKVFMRNNETSLPIKVSVITDLDIEQVSPDGSFVKSKKNKQLNKIPDPEEEAESLKTKFNVGNVKVFHSPLWTMEYDLSLGQLKSYINRATYISKLIKSRSDSKRFTWISDDEVNERIKKADELLDEWDILGYSNEYQAYLIYQILNKNKASKSVCAQWIGKLLKNENPKEITKLLESDERFKYLREAIYHVTEWPENGDN